MRTAEKVSAQSFQSDKNTNNTQQVHTKATLAIDNSAVTDLRPGCG